MDGAVFLLSRNVRGDNGAEMMQNVTVFATSAQEARAIVRDQFARLRRISASPERAYRDTPDFKIEKVSLNEPKMISAGLTG
jgi:hypothetical protein